MLALAFCQLMLKHQRTRCWGQHQLAKHQGQCCLTKWNHASLNWQNCIQCQLTKHQGYCHQAKCPGQCQVIKHERYRPQSTKHHRLTDKTLRLNRDDNEKTGTCEAQAWVNSLHMMKTRRHEWTAYTWWRLSVESACVSLFLVFVI